MEKVKLGRSGLMVTPICFGTWQLGGEWGEFDEEDAVAAIRRALDLGINLFDTAHGYGWGRSEELLGRALRDVLDLSRDDVVIATKGGLRMDGDELGRDSSRGWLREGVDRSLAALGVDYIDLYQVHWPDPETEFDETGAALAEMVQEGKIRHVGVSNFDPAQMDAISRACQVETLQPVYHLFRREIETAVLPYCLEHDIGVLAYGPLGHGLLTGTMSEDQEFPEGDWRAGSSVFRGDDFARNLRAVEELSRFAEGLGMTVSQLAIAWVLANPAVHSAIVGTRNPDHIADAVEAAGARLGPDELAEIDSLMEGSVQVGGPTPEGV